jgi:aminocarboxymuconate-semialdehyde decarboxylase
MTGQTIDVHHHILPPGYVAALGGRMGAQGLFGSPPQWSPQSSIEAMDRNGIRAAITSISAPGVWFGDTAEAARIARDSNEYAARIKGDYPGRFGFFAVLPMPDIASTLREIEYAFDVLGADGVGLMTNVDGRYPGEADFQPVFEELNRRKAVAFFHPVAAPYANPMPHVPVPSLEFPFETTRAITSLLYGGTLARCHDTHFLFSHGGGAVPFLVQRIARLTARSEFKIMVPDGVLAELARIYVDTALAANLFAFEPIRRLMPISHILFGSDFPHAGEPTLAATLMGIDEVELTAVEALAVKGNNAAALFPGFV